MHPGSSQLLWRSPGTAAAELTADGPPRAATRLTSLRALARRVTVGRPAIGWSLALLFIFKGLVCLATVAFPISGSEPTGLVGTAGALGVAARWAVWLSAARIPLLGFELLAAGGSLVTSTLIAHASTGWS